ncbi:MAG: hypothetical protein IT285_00690, partial [Bdellovibrionales bacterium]|nr:hypothetical protein [Bdellovibrionales bacterium]
MSARFFTLRGGPIAAAVAVALLAFGASTRAENFIRVGAGGASEGLRAEVGRICGNSGFTHMDGQFTCTRGAAAVPELRTLAEQWRAGSSTAWDAFWAQIPEDPPFRDYVSGTCLNGEVEAWACIENLMNYGDERFNSAAAEAEGANRYYMDSARDAWEQFIGSRRLLAVAVMACDRAQGFVSFSGAGGATLTRTGRDAECNRLPELRFDAVPNPTRPPSAEALSETGANRVTLSARMGARPMSDPSQNARSSMNSLFDAYDGFFDGAAMNCPDYLPREFCGGGGRYDATRYRPVQEMETRTVTRRSHGDYVDVEQRVPVTRFRYQESPDLDLGSMSAGEFMEGVYGAVEPTLRRDLLDFAAEVYLENYLQQARLAGPESAFQRRVTELRAAAAGASCLTDGGAKVDALVAVLPPIPADSAVRDRYRDQAALAAHCVGAIRDRWESLRAELGLDLELSRPVLKQEEIERLPGGVRHLVNGLTGLPMLRHFLREAQWATNWGEYGGRDCSFLQERMNPSIEVERPGANAAADGEVERWTASRANYCMNVYSEFTILSHEMERLFSAYPGLGERLPVRGGSSGATGLGYAQVTQAAGGIDPRVRNYSLDFNRARPGELLDPATDGLRDCMSRFRVDPVDPSAGLVGPNAASRETVDHVVASTTAVDERLASFRAELARMCENSEEYAAHIVKSPQFMGQYFNCARTRFNTLASALQIAEDARPRAVTLEQCRDRGNSSWAACRLFREVRNVEIRDEMLGQMLQMGMDLAFIVAPGIGGWSGSLGRIGAGIVIGGGLGYALAPNPGDLAADASTGVAEFRAGYATSATYEQSFRSLRALAERDPRVESALTGMVMGGVFAAVSGPSGGRGLGARATRSARDAAEAERLLIRVWREFDAEGLLSTGSAESTALRARLLATFEETLRRRYPDMPESFWGLLTAEERIAVLEGRLGVLDDVLARLPANHPNRLTIAESINNLRARLGGGTGPLAGEVSVADRGPPPPTLLRRVLGRPAVRRLIRENGVFRAIAREDNRAFIALMDDGPRAGRVFFDAENAIIKQLNDTIVTDKRLVDALSNRYRQMVYDAIQADPQLSARMVGR